VVEPHGGVARLVYKVCHRDTDNSSFTTELALNVLSRSHSLVCLHLLLRVQPAFGIPSSLHNRQK
jgi:hypothetical protein